MQGSKYDQFQKMYGTNSESMPKFEPNKQEWSVEEAHKQSQRDSIALEKYYFNLVTFIKKKKHERPKPTFLIASRKKWRNGIFDILQKRDPSTKPIHGKGKENTPPNVTSSV